MFSEKTLYCLTFIKKIKTTKAGGVEIEMDHSKTSVNPILFIYKIRQTKCF